MATWTIIKKDKQYFLVFFEGYYIVVGLSSDSDEMFKGTIFPKSIKQGGEVF
jgi:hypothetical protein